jgi:hypothetical protein
MKRQINLYKTAMKICKQFESEGFNGVKFYSVHADEQHASDYEGELTKKQFTERLKHYVTFITEPNFDSGYSSFSRDNAYVETHIDVNSTQFYNDLRKYLTEQFGEGITLNFREGCHEWEAYRESGKYCYEHWHPKAEIA